MIMWKLKCCEIMNADNASRVFNHTALHYTQNKLTLKKQIGTFDLIWSSIVKVKRTAYWLMQLKW